jgi:hypothetical protein
MLQHQEEETMKDSVAMLKIADAPVPPGALLLGWIERHPSDPLDRDGLAYAVLRMRPGIEVAWNGHNFRSLPHDWREHVELTAVGE